MTRPTSRESSIAHLWGRARLTSPFTFREQNWANNCHLAAGMHGQKLRDRLPRLLIHLDLQPVRRVARLLRPAGRGVTVNGLSAAQSHAGRVVPGGPRALRDVPRAGRQSARRRRAAPIRRAGVPRLSALRLPGRRLRKASLYGVRPRRLVPFSCKGRGFCPSCGGRRMAERAAHLVDHVFPPVPVRQWVLSLPHRLRYVLAGITTCAARSWGCTCGRFSASCATWLDRPASWTVAAAPWPSSSALAGR